MNFFSHAIIASRRSNHPSWILGSMVPDFCTMAGLRLDSVSDNPILKDGVKFHHLTDIAFHGAPLVVSMMDSVRRDMEELGLSKGPAKAMGHVGLELLLDGVLVDVYGVQESYREAVCSAAQASVYLTFAGLDCSNGQNRWQRFAEKIIHAPVPDRYNDPGFVAERLIQMLASRRYLAIPDTLHEAVQRWVHQNAPRVADMAEALLEQVESRLQVANA